MKNNQRKTAKKNKFIPIKILVFIGMVIFSTVKTQAQSKTVTVTHFDKVIVSPHIQVVFKQGDEETVTIENISVPHEKINIEVHGKTLRLYLDDAKMVTKSEKVRRDKWQGRRSIYKGTIVTATVTYTALKELSLRGEETFICESPLEVDSFRLKIYGGSQVYLNEVKLQSLRATIYGNSYLEIKGGSIERQKFTAYGESKINTLEVNNETTKITAYGEGSFRFNVSENLKITAYGEAIVAYEGNPEVQRGIVIGEATIQKIR
ncbi:MAG: head GIN domain-containing protein [Flavobacteriaceae bacterium]